MTPRGFTLTELIVSVAIAGVVATAATATLVRQQRFYAAAVEMLEVKSQLRDASDILVADIRGAITAYGVPLMSDSAVELFATIGTSVVCTAPASGSITLPPATLASGNTLTSLLATPDTGDLIAVYIVPSESTDSPRWETRKIAAFATRSFASACPAATGFTSPADASAGATGYGVTLGGSSIAGIRKGSLVRFVRRARYSIYRSSDNLWYLGYRRCSASVSQSCAAIQPLSGPYRAYSSRGESGVAFRYFNARGDELSSGASGNTLARIDIVLRGETRRRALAGDARKSYRDSVVVSVSPRNRLR